MLLIGVTLASAATLRVGPARPYTTLQSALAAAAAGDRIEVDAGTYTGPFDVARAVSIVGPSGPASTTLVASRGDQVLFVEASLTLSGFTVNGQNARRGLTGAPGLSSLTVDDCVFTNGRAVSGLLEGGGIFARDAVVSVTDSTFGNNDAWSGGAATFLDAAGLTLQRNRFVGNRSHRGVAGAVNVYTALGAPLITDNVFARNEAYQTAMAYSYGGSGGALAMGDAPGAEVSRNVFSHNVASDSGGAVFLESADAEVLLEGNRFCANTADEYGGAVAVTQPDADTVFTGNDFGGNSARYAGGIYAGDMGGYYPGPGVVDLVDNTFASNDGGHADINYATRIVNNIFASAPGTAVSASPSTIDYNLWWDNGTNLSGSATGAHDVFADPRLIGWSDDGDCTNDTAEAIGAGVDAGTPALVDDDGTASDIGSGP